MLQTWDLLPIWLWAASFGAAHINSNNFFIMQFNVCFFIQEKRNRLLFFNTLIFLHFFLSLESSKEMSINIHPTNIFLYFDNHLCYSKAKSLCSVCMARCIRYISSKTRRQNSEYKCHCFKCRVYRMPHFVLFSRRHLRFMSILSANNYMVSEKYIRDCFRKKSNGKS